jgi:hypothetical protein
MENWSTGGDGLSLVIGCVSASAPFGGSLSRRSRHFAKADDASNTKLNNLQRKIGFVWSEQAQHALPSSCGSLK